MSSFMESPSTSCCKIWQGWLTSQAVHTLHSHMHSLNATFCSKSALFKAAET